MATYVNLEGNWINPEQVCVVRPADSNREGFQTEVILAAGMQTLRMSVEEVAEALMGAQAQPQQ
jgi:hypothetical protein